MIENAKEYNVEGSEIYNDAVQLEALLAKLLPSNEIMSATGAETNAAEENEELTSMIVKNETYELGRHPNIVSVISTDANLKNIIIFFLAGEFLYIANPIEPIKPTIGQILRIFLAKNGSTQFEANWFLRPEQTVHKASQKFLENEVLKSNRSETYSMDDVVGRCWVLYIKDYIRGKPKGATDMKHVYVCESRYNDQVKAHSKIKQWNYKGREPELELYKVPLIPVKVASIFATEETLAAAGSKKRKQSEDFGSDVDAASKATGENTRTRESTVDKVGFSMECLVL
jgi:chromatin structure-remodeling complex subunit RSC1/2